MWEVALKLRLGKLPELSIGVAELPTLAAESGFTPLPVHVRHAAAVAALPLHHRDPFDHLLIAQARIEGLKLVSRDPAFGADGVALQW